MRLVAIVAVVAIVLVGGVVSAQSDQSPESRIAALETRVADLETRLAILEGAESAPQATPSASQDANGVTFERAGNGAFRISGTGSVTTEGYQIPAGLYDLTTEWFRGCCIFVHVYGPDGWDSFLFDGRVNGESGGIGSDSPEFPTTGRYYFAISQTDGPWVMTFQPK